MWNGFYNLEMELPRLKEFFAEALSLSINSRVDVKLPGCFNRVKSDIPAIDYINNTLSLATHNVVVNRYVYNGCAAWADKQAEIGSSVIIGDSKYLFIYVTLEVLEQLVTKYGLTKKEI